MMSAPGSRSDSNGPGGSLSWENFFDSRELIRTSDDQSFCVYNGGDDTELVFVFLHGGGHSSLPWALVANKLRPHYRVVAFDFRGHGLSTGVDDNNLAIDTLVDDTLSVISEVVPSTALVVLVGHSLGGVVSVRTAARGRANIVGVAVVDVVEGTAIPALVHMPGILRRRPTHFDSEEDAIRWSTQSGMLKNRASARVSIPPQLKFNSESGVFEWRTNLLKSQPHWRGWYEGMTAAFLSLSAAKLLILAGPDRLDREMMIAQMQGKLQVSFIAGGHSLQEDSPDQIADVLLKFVERHRFVEMAQLNRRRE